jgi:hypothetical protein
MTNQVSDLVKRVLWGVPGRGLSPGYWGTTTALLLVSGVVLVSNGTAKSIVIGVLILLIVPLSIRQ